MITSLFRKMLKLTLLILIAVSELRADPSIDKLAKDLMKNYVEYVYPGHLDVSFGISLTSIDFDQKEEVLTSYVWERLVWTDSRLSWNPSQYSGTKLIRIPDKMIWKPDITLFNEMIGESAGRKEVNAVISNSGSVIWVPPAVYKTKCQVSNDGTIYCALKFGSWTYDGLTMKLNYYEGQQEVDLSDFSRPKRYDLVNATAILNNKYYSCCAEPYIDYTVTITLKRKGMLKSVHV